MRLPFEHSSAWRRSSVPVQKFRSIEEMNAAPAPLRTEDGFNRFIRHCSRYRRLAPRDYPRGVFKFRSIEEAQAARARLAGRD